MRGGEGRGGEGRGRGGEGRGRRGRGRGGGRGRRRGRGRGGKGEGEDGGLQKMNCCVHSLIPTHTAAVQLVCMFCSSCCGRCVQEHN